MDELAKAGQKEQLLLLAWMVTHQWEIGPVRVPGLQGAVLFQPHKNLFAVVGHFLPAALFCFSFELDLCYSNPKLFSET